MPALPIPEPFIVDELTLRVPTSADVPAIAAGCRDQDVQRFARVPSPYTDEDAHDFVEFAEEAPGNGRGAHLVIIDAGALVGVVGMAVDLRDLTGELGYWLTPAGRGRGVATRACHALCAVAFHTWRLGRVGLMASVANPASQAVAERLGFVLEGTARRAGIDGPSGDPTAPRIDMRSYGLLPHELQPPDG